VPKIAEERNRIEGKNAGIMECWNVGRIEKTRGHKKQVAE
jgi:hypothetical protein